MQADGQWTGGSVDRPLSRTKWADGRIGMQATYGTANGQVSWSSQRTALAAASATALAAASATALAVAS